MGAEKTKTKRQIQKELTRKKIIKAAFYKFAQKGLINTSTEDIAKAAMVSHGTVFVHFSTKEELLIEIIKIFGKQLSHRLHELAAEKKSLKDILMAHIKGIMEFEEFYTRLVIESRLLPKPAREIFIAIQSTISFHINQAAERELKAGRMQSHPVHMIFNTWISLIHYYLSNGDIFSPGKSVIERYGEELADYYFRLISTK